MNKIISGLTLILIIAVSCKKGSVNSDPIADVPVNITINMALPTYVHLLNDNTFAFADGGVKGVTVVHIKDDEYYALDRCCSFQPNNACSKVEIDSAVMMFRCGESKVGGFVKCCDSRFMLDGQVFNGPATFGLKHYQVLKTGNLLNIKN